MKYINTTSMQVSDLGTIRYQHPNMSIPDGADLSDIGYEKVYPSRPTYDPATQYITPLPPAELDGTWTEQWQVNDLPPVVPVIPHEVTMRQARLALLQAGKLAIVEAAIAAMPSPQKEAAQIEWEYSNSVLRTNQLILALAPAFGMSEEDMDQLFVFASTL